MARKGQQTAYDRRRYITLVQVLASNDFNGLRALAEASGVEQPTYEELQQTHSWTHTMAVKLAQHAIEYHQEEEKNE